MFNHECQIIIPKASPSSFNYFLKKLQYLFAFFILIKFTLFNLKAIFIAKRLGRLGFDRCFCSLFSDNNCYFLLKKLRIDKESSSRSKSLIICSDEMATSCIQRPKRSRDILLSSM